MPCGLLALIISWDSIIPRCKELFSPEFWPDRVHLKRSLYVSWKTK